MQTPTPSRSISYLLAVVLAITGLTLTTGGASASATVAEEQQQAQQVQCATQDQNGCRITKRTRKWTRNFHDGAGVHSNGFSPQRAFAKPKASRKIIIPKIARMLRAARAAGSSSADRVAAGGWRLVARGVYSNMVDDAECVVDYDQMMSVRVCNGLDGKKLALNLIELITVTACAAGVAVSILTPVGRAASGVYKAFGIGTQVTQCTGAGLVWGMTR